MTFKSDKDCCHEAPDCGEGSGCHRAELKRQLETLGEAYMRQSDMYRESHVDHDHEVLYLHSREAEFHKEIENLRNELAATRAALLEYRNVGGVIVERDALRAQLALANQRADALSIRQSQCCDGLNTSCRHTKNDPFAWAIQRLASLEEK